MCSHKGSPSLKLPACAWHHTSKRNILCSSAHDVTYSNMFSKPLWKGPTSPVPNGIPGSSPLEMGRALRGHWEPQVPCRSSAKIEEGTLCLKKGLYPKCHLFLFPRDAIWSNGLLQLFVSIFSTAPADHPIKHLLCPFECPIRPHQLPQNLQNHIIFDHKGLLKRRCKPKYCFLSILMW